MSHTVPLRCKKLSNGTISIRIGIDVLRFAAENSPDYYDGDKDMGTIKISDAQVFAKEVVRSLNDEAEDGSTLVTRMLDSAISQAISNGCDGVGDA